MRIVMLTPDLTGRSGWSRYALDLGHSLSKRGHTLHCIVAEKTNASWCTEDALLRQPTSYLNNPALCFLDARKIRSMLDRLKPDIVHIIAEPYALTLPFMGHGSWKTVLTIHGTYSVVPLMMGRITALQARTYYRRIDQIVAVSTFTKNYVQARLSALWKSAELEGKTRVIHNAISLTGIRADTSPRTDQHTHSIISVSGIKRKKGHLESLRAVRRFLDTHCASLRYDIIGNDAIDPAFTDELRRTISELRLDDVVRIRGTLSENELDDAYRAADLFLLPSLQEGDYFEGFGLVFIEANARGTPVIGGATGGCPEAIKESVSVYVCDPTDTDALARRIANVLIDHSIRREECRAWAQEHDITRIIPRFEELYASA